LLHLKRLQECDQWHFFRVSTFLPVRTVNCVPTLKGFAENRQRCMLGRRAQHL
jgi:hypothetical protein